MTWKLAEAKNRLTEVVNLALSEGPQTITRRGDTVLLVSAADYAALTGPKMGFKEFLFGGESLEGLDLERDDRDWDEEAAQECRDLLAYLAMHKVAEQHRRRERLRCEAAGELETKPMIGGQ